MNESDIYTFIGEVRSELRAIRDMLSTHQTATATELADHDKRLDALEQWKSNLMGRIAVWGTVLAAGGALLLALLK